MIKKVTALKIEAMKARDTSTSGFWATVLGELQLANSKKTITEEDAIRIVGKMRKNAAENLEKYSLAGAQEEMDLLDTILPKQASLEEDTETILGLNLNLDPSDNIGKMTGMVMKALKQEGLTISGGRVKEVLEGLIKE